MSAVFPSLISPTKKKEPDFNVDLLFRLTQFEMQLPSVLQNLGEELANEALKEVKKNMRTAGYADSIIDGTTVTNVEVTPDGFLEFEITSERTSDEGFDIATAHEKGTRDHRIDLRGGPDPVSPPFALSWIQDGQRFFSKGHVVKGIKASNIISDTLLKISGRLQAKLNAAVDDNFTQTVNP